MILLSKSCVRDTEGEKGRGLPEVSKLRSTGLTRGGTYTKVWPLTHLLNRRSLPGTGQLAITL